MKVSIYNGLEQVFPNGRYSMAAIISARPVENPNMESDESVDSIMRNELSKEEN